MKTLLAIAVAMLMAPLVAGAFKVGFAWDPNPETNIAEYRLYIGSEPGEYGDPIATSAEAATDAEPLVVNLPVGGVVYVVVTAVNDIGLESLPSDHVAVDLTPPIKPGKLRVAGMSVSFDVGAGEDARLYGSKDLAEWDLVATVSAFSGIEATIGMQDPPPSLFYRLGIGPQ